MRANVPFTTASYELGKLEAYRLVVRKGSRGGWRPQLRAEVVYRELLRLYRRKRDYVRKSTLMHHLNQLERQDMNDHTIWGQLRLLMRGGLVVSEKRGFYKPVRHEDVIPAGSKVLTVLSALYHADFNSVRTVRIADELDVSGAYVRRQLKALEADGCVVRQGSRGGWKPAYVA